MLYKTTDKTIIKLFEIYNYIKYFYINIIEDIRPSIKILNKSYIETELIIKSLINPLELEIYLKFQKELINNYNLSIPDNIQSLIFNCNKWFRIIKNMIKLKLNIIDTSQFNYSNMLLSNFSNSFYKHYKNIYDVNGLLSVYEYIDIYDKNQKFFYNTIIKFSNIEEGSDKYINLMLDIKNNSLQLIKPNNYHKIIKEIKAKYNI